MHAAQLNEFLGAFGQNHIISPIGYGKVMKTVRRGSPVRSATEQHTIHNIAAQFFSPLIFIPRVHELIDTRSYLMDHVAPGHYLRTDFYKTNMHFIQELNRFYKHMIAEGYYPFNYTILYHETGQYTLMDFSQFGTYQDGAVQFKHLKKPINLFEAERHYGILSFLVTTEIVLDSEKIEICVYDPPD
jgi:hypothetical protein